MGYHEEQTNVVESDDVLPMLMCPYKFALKLPTSVLLASKELSTKVCWKL